MLYMPGTCKGGAQISIYRYLWVEVGVATLNLALALPPLLTVRFIIYQHHSLLSNIPI